MDEHTEEILDLLNRDIKDLFVMGGDSRMHIDQATGLNKYGCSPEPRNVVALSSCTASSPSPRAYGAATEMKYWLKLAAERGVLEEATELAFMRLRVRLRQNLEIDHIEDLAVALTPSGTDAEIIASALALSGKHNQRLCNIVSAPLEVGSGTVLAAGGLSFDSHQPREASGEDIGEPVSGDLSDLIDVITVGLRDSNGEVRSTEILDNEVRNIVEQRVKRGDRVLLHVVAHSKTGAHAPSLALVNELSQRYEDQVVVVVDAAQGRISRHGLVSALEQDYMVLFTGSKFFCGPPFSGALFVPKKHWPTGDQTETIVAQTKQYFGAYEMPTEWHSVRESLPKRPNLGLIVRWAAAISEIEAYYATEPKERMRVFQAFEPIVNRTLLQSAWVSRFSYITPSQSSEERMLESNTTVVSFRVQRAANKEEYFDADELRVIYHWLNTDMSFAFDDLEGEDALAMAQTFHIGQPVKMSSNGDIAVLRVALGSTTIVTMVGNDTFGPDFQGRMLWFEHQMDHLRIKLELLAEHFDRLTSMLAQPSS